MKHKHNKYNKFQNKKFKPDKKHAVGKKAYERLDSSPYPKSHRVHKKNHPWRLTDGKKYPCIIYKNGYQYSKEYKEKYEQNKKKVV